MEARVERHRAYVSQVSLIAEELGYNLEFFNIENEPGKPDLILKNPKNGRRAYVEVEVTFQQQVGHQRKLLRRYQDIQKDLSQGINSVLLVIGARRRDLISLCERAGIPNPEQEYGRLIFSCVSYSDQNEIRAVLIRCLGDE